jgi:SAM-dependent methyltransferase
MKRIVSHPTRYLKCPLCSHPEHRFEREVDGHPLVRCRDCAMVFANPQPKPAEMDEVYRVRDEDALIDLYSRIATPTVLAGYDRRLERLRAMNGGTGRLLDFGCAAAYFTERAQAGGWDAVGLDLGNWVEEAARRRGVRNVMSCELAQAGFEPGSFDVINAAQVFEHVPRPVECLRQLVTLIRPGGLLYLDVPNYRTLSIVLGRDDFELNTPPQHLNYFAPGTLRRFLEKAGLSVMHLAANDGLKWENLLNRPISSEIALAYASHEKQRSQAPQAPLPGWKPVRRMLDGLLYDGLKLGMNLYSYSRLTA